MMGSNEGLARKKASAIFISHALGLSIPKAALSEATFMDKSIKKKMLVGFALYISLFFFMVLLLFVNLSVNASDSISLLGAVSFVLIVLFYSYRWTMKDIQERQKAGERLQESEERYRDLLENANDLIQSLTPQGKFIYVNQAWKNILGYTDEEITNLSMLDIVHTDSREKCLEIFKSILRGEKCGLIETTFLRKDGDIILVEGTVNCHFKDGKPLATRAIFRDVTQRKLAVKALRESEKRYRDLIDKSKGLVCMHDLEGRLLSFNPMAAKMVGYEPEELIGKNMRQLIHPSFRHHWDKYLSQIIKQKSDAGFMRVITKNGESRTWVYSNSLYEEAGKEPYVIGHAQDITEFKEVQSLSNRLTSIVETTSDYIGTATPEGKMFYANAALRKALGVGEEEDISNRYISEFKPLWAAEMILNEGIPYALKHGLWSGENALLGADGREIPISQVIIAHKSSKGPVRFLSTIARNITEQKATENRLFAQDAITRVLAQAATVSEAVPKVLETICKTLKWEVGAFWKLDREKNLLVCDSIWHNASIAVDEFKKATMDIQLASGKDLPGRVLQIGKPLWIEDVTQAHFLLRTPITEDGKLFSAFAFPILLGDTPLGAIEFFSDKVRYPDFELLNLMAGIGSQIGQFIERKRAEAAMRESEARKSAILESALDCIITVDHEGRVAEFNPAAEKTFGYTRKAVVGKALADLIVSNSMTYEQRLGIDPYFAAGDKNYLGKRIEIKARRADGTEFLADLAVAPIETEGTPMFTAYLRDITEPKRAEIALQQSNELLQALSRAQTEFITEVERKVLFGDLLEALLSLTESEYGFIGEVRHTSAGKPFLKTYAITNIFWDKKRRELYDKYSAIGMEIRNLKALFEESLQTGKPVIYGSPYEAEPHAEFAQGLLELQTSLCLPIYSGEEMIGMIGIANRHEGYNQALIQFLQPFASTCGNLIQAYKTEQRRKQAELEVAKLSLVASKTNNAVVITNGRGLVEWVNDGFVRLTGYSLQEVRGKKPGTLLQGAESDQQTSERISELLKAKIDFTEEILNYRKDGQPFWVSINFTPILNEAGEVIRYVAVQTDITERKFKQEELRLAKEAAESASIAKSQFLAVMSHEIRTPMNAIIGMTDLALQTKLTPEQSEFLHIVQTNSEALLYLINDILDFSKIEAGQMDIDNLAFNPREIVEGVAELLSVRAGSKRVELICRVSNQLPQRLMGDPNRFRQILLNLAGNAIKFTEAGEVIIAVEAIVCAENNRAEIHCFVADTGIGIAEDKRAKVFDKFYQADDSTTRKYGGSGLGLSISKLLAELMNGRMWFESELGKGSTFHCQIPFSIVEAPQSVSMTADFSGRQALIVDDNQTCLFTMAEMLEEFGLEVTCVCGANQALENLQRHAKNYDLIFVDKFMPDMDGLDLAKTIRLAKDFSEAKLILMSPLGLEDAGLMQELDIAEQLTKPIFKKRLLDCLDKILLPKSRETVAALQSAQSQTNAGKEPKKYCILVVEDNVDNQNLAKRILQNAGYAVDIAENGEIAVQRARDYHYDLIYMDIQMPLMDGFSATQEIRRIEKERGNERVPIVALTAHAIEGYRDKCIEYDMDDYLSKPIKRQRLLEKTDEWMDKRPVILVVDDSVPSHVLIKNYLKEADYKLFFAHNGEQGLDLLNRHWVSLVLLDMEMPILDGYATAQAIRQNPVFANLPVIAMTGHDGVEEKYKCLASGCSDYVAKPLRKQKVLEVISTSLMKAKQTPQEGLPKPEETSQADNHLPILQENLPMAEAFAAEAVSTNGKGKSADEILVYVDEDIADLVPEFLDGRREDVSKIERMIQENNFSVLYTLGHDMKGCGQGYGFDEISIIGKHIESAAKEQNAPEVLIWNDRLKNYLEAVRVLPR